MQHTSNGPGKAKKQALSNQTAQQNEVFAPPQTSLVALQGLGQQTLPSNPLIENREQMPQVLQQSSQEEQPTNIPLHLLMQRQQSALDTLAEVSRRHMDYSTNPQSYTDDLEDPTTSRQVQDPSTSRNDREISPPDSFLQYTMNARRDNPQIGLMHGYFLEAFQRYNSHGNIAPRPVEPISNSSYPAYVAQAQVGAEHPAFSNDAVQPPLVHTTTIASHQMNQSNLRPNDAPIDPQLGVPMDNNETILPERLNEALPQPQDDFIAWTEAPQEFVTQQAPPSNEPNPEFGTAHKSDKNNARARFTDTRRKEVQEVRKRGACMRCRMLKKPCSEGTPCGTCKKIDTARLWKGTCLRTKLADEFTLYSTSYFHSRMATQLSGAMHGLLLVPLPGSIQVKFNTESAFAVSLSAKSHRIPTNNQDVNDNAQANGMENAAKGKDFIVLDDVLASQKVSNFCTNDKIIQDCIMNEKSAFLKATLQEAVELLHTEKSQEQYSNAKSGSRTNHISPSVLLSNVLELWVETNILVPGHPGTLQIRHNSSGSPCQDPQTVDWSDDSGQESRPMSPDSLSYDLIRSQLLGATENACHRLSRAVMNELERRLLQRQQVSAFATFVSVVVLFSCIERITSFYHAMDTSHPPSTAGNGATVLSPQPGTESTPPGYPASVPAPSTLWPQGPHFARLLTTLLRMRALPPKTTLTTDNKLAVLREPGLPVRLNGVAVRDQQDAETARAANWLDPLRLNVDFLRSRRDGDVADVGWEMKFISAVLLSEGM
ncbi:hypothetical protein MBLNU13_g09421t1 [Cladosporium sp. NU13]